jgi:signal transduction histidine kinase
MSDPELAAPHFGLCELDDRLVVRRLDAGFRALAGDAADTLVGRPFDDLLSARDRRGAARFHALVSHESAGVDLVLGLRLGARELRARILMSRVGAGYCAVIEDLGAPSNLVNELLATGEMWHEVVRQSVEGVALLDDDGRIMQFNPAFFRLLDLRSQRGVPLTEEAIQGALLVELATDSNLTALRAHLQLFFGSRDEFELELQHRGRELEFVGRPLALPLQQIVGLCLLARDVTVRRRAVQLRAALDHARDELLRKEKLAALGGLVTGVAHEINTPLGVALTATSLVGDRIAEIRRAFEAGALRQTELRSGLGQAGEAADIALGNLRRAAGLVASFKQIAVDQASEARRELLLGSYVREVVASLSPLYRRTPHRVAVDVRADPAVTTYAGAISQVCTNLLHNALIHAFPEGQVGTVALWVDRTAAGELELGCRDDGAGMSEAVLRRIYEPFYTTARARGGSGLGLHIVHNLVTDLLRGTIAAQSEPGRGTSFLIRFPASPETADVEPRR